MSEPVNFADVQIGDTLTFATRDNGFGGSGGYIDRTGVVNGITDKSVTVSGVSTLRFPTWPREATGTARLRKTDWYDRCVRRVAKVGDQR